MLLIEKQGTMNFSLSNNISYRNELKRKIIHISSGIIPICTFLYDKTIILNPLILFTMIFVLIDILKINVNQIKIIYKYIFQSISRETEIDKLTGASYVLIGYTSILIIFPKNIAVFSMFILCFSDTLAALFGRKFGKIKVGNKSLEGLFAFIFSGLLISCIFQSIPFFIRFASVIFAGLIELNSIKINDNITIPWTVSIICIIGIELL